MTNSKDKAPTTCFTSILRRLLCTGGLPTHPSSDTDNPSKTDLAIKHHQPSSPTRSTIPAGIVARLMGLESFPNSSHNTTIMRKSRSVGSVDFLPNFNRIPHHHRSRTSVSFRELPTFLQTSRNNMVGKSEVRLTSIEEKSQNLNNKKKVQIEKQSLKVKSDDQEVKSRRKREVLNAAKKKVIDDGFPEDQKKKKKCKSRKRTYNHPLPKMGKHDHRKAKKKEMLKRRSEREYSEEYCIKVLMEVCRLTTDDINESGCVVNNIQDISYEIGQEILQGLVYEMIDDLCRFP